METLALIANTEHVFDIIGLIGVAFYVGSYVALQFGKLDGNSIRYSLYNGTAATLVLISLFHDFNLASAIIQVVWISATLYGLVRFLLNKRNRNSDSVVSSVDVRRATRLRRRTNSYSA